MIRNKRYNWKARQPTITTIDNSHKQDIKVDFDSSKDHYDASNELVLPSSKRKTKVKRPNEVKAPFLSKQRRKQLEKVVEKKKKKQQRAGLLEALKEVQATPDELQQLTSIASIQTKGLKRHFWELQNPDKVNKSQVSRDNCGQIRINSIKGAKRLKMAKEVEKIDDLNVVGFEEDPITDSDEDSDESVKEEIKEECKSLTINEETLISNEETLTINEKTPKINEESLTKHSMIDLNDIKTEENSIESEQKSKDKIAHKKTTKKTKATFVEVERTKEIQAARLKLPILAEEQEIMETISESDVTIIAGETGSGKTTQIPQFLYEAGYALDGKLIGVTEPRRVAAIAMSTRVGVELNNPELSGYLIRFEGNVQPSQTRIKFMTDGVLLKEAQSDFLLANYSALVLDEAHERSVYTDILVGLLSRIVPLRRKRGTPLKLVIMSATLRLEDFLHNRRLFKVAPPVVKVEARQFPVTVHFNKRTGDDYMQEAFRKACKVHAQLPDGGILVFVTGQLEVNALVRRLRLKFPMKARYRVEADKEEVDDVGVGGFRKRRKKRKIVAQVDLDDYSLPNEDADELDNEDLIDDEQPFDLNPADTDLCTSDTPLYVLPLYSLLASEKQARVFKPPPNGCRLCVVATNVAETSLTIPNVKYVIDTGKTKVKLYDRVTGVTSFVVQWTSQASADQRAGRAGRTAPGHCYRLYSSAVFNDTFAKFGAADIQRRPVDDLYLQMKCMHIDKVVNFPFPTPPDLEQLKCAQNRLKTLGALDDELKVTKLGRAIAKFPVLPRYGKMLALSHQFDLLPYVITLVAALSVQEVLVEVLNDTSNVSSNVLNNENESNSENKASTGKFQGLRQQWAGHGHSLLLGDAGVLIKAVGAADYAHSRGKLQQFCVENGVREKALLEIRKLRLQLTNEIRAQVPEIGDDLAVDPKMAPPNDLQCKFLRQILLAGLGDQVARKVQPEEIQDGGEKRRFKYAYKANNMEDPVFLHRNSVLRRTLPELVVYQEIYETNKIYLRGATAIEPEWLLKYVPSLCNVGEPLNDPEPRFDDVSGTVLCSVRASFGPQNWPLPQLEIEYQRALGAYKYFARFLLEGRVFPRLKKYTKALLSQPSTMVKSWVNLQKRSDSLLKSLKSNGVSSREDLLSMWKRNPQYLLSEYLLWLPESAHGEVSLFWPPLLEE